MFYIFNGIYSPISCLLIEKIIVNDAKLPSIIKSLPGPFHKKKNKAIDGSKNVLVYFVGGCTYSEICALRFLSQKLKINIKIATNVIYNKNSFTELMVENYKVL
ncbi:hypothetical protein A3Q56_06992 [Intoshia linei]|uniref:Vacuolar protein sorting-associated protein 33A n=1 Tax=Intoshia linei TaxID=1819745 RepID=A0A177ATH1_9BILA|nr:hypothetical protein A3Q56_06992 [Intoshia linei]